MKRVVFKKALSIALVAMIALSIFPPMTALAAPGDAFTIVVGDGAAKPGQYVEITYSAKNNPGIAAYTLGLSYDSSLLTLASITSSASGYFVSNASATTASATTASPTTGYPWASGTTASSTSASPTSSMAYAVWTNGYDIHTDGTLFTARFMINWNAPRGAVAHVQLDNGFEIINETYAQVGYATTPGEVTIWPPDFGDVNLDGDVDVRDLILLMQYLARLVSLTDEQLANANIYPDSAIDARDTLLLQQHLLEPTFYTPGVIPVI